MKTRRFFRFRMRPSPPRTLSWLAAVLFLPALAAAQAVGGQTLDAAMRHLGDSEIKDWPGIAVQPEGTRLDLAFNATANAGPVTLQVRQRDVDGVWRLKLNGREIAELRRKRPEKDCFYEVPTGVLRDGVNQLELVPDNATDDIAVGGWVLFEEPLRSRLKLREVAVQVTDQDTGTPLPVRLSVVAEDGTTPDIYFPRTGPSAVREGLIYLNGAGGFELPAGSYRMAATRGMEWSRAEQVVDLRTGPARVEFRLRREVDTTGFIAADTHIHTYELSGHGDATVAERVISIAGEGVELAVATDHNHHTDYRPQQEQLDLTEYFTPVTGNEVTTGIGHFNAFPLPPDGERPNHKESDWVQLVDDMRLKGAKVVILNHPRWPNIKQSPLEVLGLNRATGDRAAGTRFTFDAMELVNATVDTPDPLYLFADWFGLLNAGEKIAAVGSSDTHTVGDPVGQGRTYIPSRTDDPAALSVAELVEQLRLGRASVSLGIFATVQVNGQFGAGDLAPVDDGKVTVRLRVAAPGWIQPREAVVYLNGAPVAEQTVPTQPGEPTNATLSFEIPVPGVDAHLVCLVTGDPVKHAGWKTLNDYTLGATNPVFLDANRDGRYSSPRESAQRIYASTGGDVESLMHTLEVVPPPVGVQILTLAHPRVDGFNLVRLNDTLRRLAEMEPAFALYWAQYQAARTAPVDANPPAQP